MTGVLKEKEIEKLAEEAEVNFDEGDEGETVKVIEKEIGKLEKELNKKKRERKEFKKEILFENVYQEVYDKLCKHEEEKDEELEEKLKGIEDVYVYNIEDEFEYFFDNHVEFLIDVYETEFHSLKNPIKQIFDWMVYDYRKRLHVIKGIRKLKRLIIDDNGHHARGGQFSFNIKCPHIPLSPLEEVREKIHDDVYWSYLTSKCAELIEFLEEKFEVSKFEFDVKGRNGGWLIYTPDKPLLSFGDLDAFEEDLLSLGCSPKNYLRDNETIENRVLRELNLIKNMKKEVENFVDKVQTEQEFAKFIEENVSK